MSACKGHDEHLGAFEDTHGFVLIPRIMPETPAGIGLSVMRKRKVAYTGEAITDGPRHIAMNFASTSDKTDHGVLSGRIDLGTPVRFSGEYF